MWWHTLEVVIVIHLVILAMYIVSWVVQKCLDVTGKRWP